MSRTLGRRLEARSGGAWELSEPLSANVQRELLRLTGGRLAFVTELTRPGVLGIEDVLGKSDTGVRSRG
jgi:hypothetical protein